MMVNCPKCGFSQPQDRYCASCGVDMVAFRPAQKPLGTRLVQNTALQVVTLGAVVTGIAFYVKEQNDAEFAKRVAQTPIARNVEQEEAELASSQERQALTYNQETEAAREAANLAASQRAAETAASRARVGENDQTSSQSANFASTAVAASAQDASPSPSPSASPTQAAGVGAGAAKANDPAKAVSVYFIELPRERYSDLFAEAKQAGGDGVINFGVIDEVQKRLGAMRAARTVGGTQDRPLRLNQPASALSLTANPVAPRSFGFAIQVTPVLVDESGTHLQVSFKRELMGDPAVGRDSFAFQAPEALVVQKRGAVVVTGVLPHRPLFEGEQQVYRTSELLRVMTGGQFRQGISDVALVIEAK